MFILTAPQKAAPTGRREAPGYVRLKEPAEAPSTSSAFDGDAASRCDKADVLRLAIGYGLPHRDNLSSTRFSPKVRNESRPPIALHTLYVLT